MRTSGVPCTGVILAGGSATRFGGEPKGLRIVGGRRVIDRVRDALAPVTDTQLLVANDPHAVDWLPGVRVEHDVLDARGSLVGIHAALARARTPVLVVAWDMPFVTPALLAELRRAGEASACAAVPEGPRGVEACCAYYTPAALPVAARQIAEGAMRLSAFIDALPTAWRLHGDALAALGDPTTLFLNVNDAASLADAERLASRMPA